MLDNKYHYVNIIVIYNYYVMSYVGVFFVTQLLGGLEFIICILQLNFHHLSLSASLMFFLVTATDVCILFLFNQNF